MRTEAEIRNALEIAQRDLAECESEGSKHSPQSYEYQDAQREYDKIAANISLLKWILDIDKAEGRGDA